MKAERIQKLRENAEERFACIWSTVSVLVSSQIRALRLHSDTPRQKDFAKAAGMQQSVISRYETPGANVTLETLAKIAAANSVALKVEFVPFSEMRDWEVNFSQDLMRVTRLEEDDALRHPAGFRVPAFSVPRVTTLCRVGAPTLPSQNFVYTYYEGRDLTSITYDFGSLNLPLPRPRASELPVQDYFNAQKHAGPIVYTA